MTTPTWTLASAGETFAACTCPHCDSARQRLCVACQARVKPWLEDEFAQAEVVWPVRRDAQGGFQEVMQ